MSYQVLKDNRKIYAKLDNRFKLLVRNVLRKEHQELKEQLIELSGNESSIGGGVRLLRSIRKGVIQYAEIPEL